MEHGLIGKFAKETIVDANGRITLNKKIRDHLKIKEGQRVKVYAFDNFAVVTTDVKNASLFSFEYLYNKIEKVEKQNVILNEKFAEFRTMVINVIMKNDRQNEDKMVKDVQNFMEDE